MCVKPKYLGHVNLYVRDAERSKKWYEDLLGLHTYEYRPGWSAFLSADLDLTPEVRDDHAAYIASWIKVLKDDKRAIFTAASHAQRAADFLHGLRQSAPAHADAT